MNRFVIFFVLLLACSACSPPANSRYGKWVPVDGITVVSEPGGETILTSADLTQAMIVVEAAKKKTTIWFQLTDAAAERYRPPTDEQKWTLELQGTKLASVTDQQTIGSSPNNYLFRVADVSLPSGKQMSEVLLIRQNDAQ